MRLCVCSNIGSRHIGSLGLHHQNSNKDCTFLNVFKCLVQWPHRRKTHWPRLIWNIQSLSQTSLSSVFEIPNQSKIEKMVFSSHATEQISAPLRRVSACVCPLWARMCLCGSLGALGRVGPGVLGVHIIVLVAQANVNHRYFPCSIRRMYHLTCTTDGAGHELTATFRHRNSGTATCAKNLT